MKKSLFILASALILAQSCFIRVNVPAELLEPQGEVITKSSDLEGQTVNAVSLAASFDVTIVPGDSLSYEISAPEKEVDKVNVLTDGEGTLILTTKPGTKHCRNVSITVTMPELERVTVSGSGDIDASGFSAGSFEATVNGSGDVYLKGLKCDKLVAAVNGSGDISVKMLSCTELVASVVGSGDVEVEGVAQKAVFNVTGSGDIDADRLRCEEVSKSVIGSGSISL